MSRNIQRQIARTAARKEDALEMYAKGRYGEQVTLADVHPDVKKLFAVAFVLHEANKRRLNGVPDDGTLDTALGRLSALLTAYEPQENIVHERS